MINAIPQRDGNDPFNQAFSFTPEEYAALKVARPDLFDPGLSPQDKRALWVDFANSSVGQHFRWR